MPLHSSSTPNLPTPLPMPFTFSTPPAADKFPSPFSTPTKSLSSPVRCSPRGLPSPLKSGFTKQRQKRDLCRFVAAIVAAGFVLVYLQASVFRVRKVDLDGVENGSPLRLSASKALLEAVREGDERRSLAEAVAAVSKGAVITSIVNAGYLDFTENWLKSIERLGYLDRVLLFAEDEEAYNTIDAQWPGHVVSLEHENIPHANGSAHDFGSLGFYLMTERRPDYLRSILEFGVDVFYTDLDMVFLKDPFPSFKGDYDMWVQDDWGEFCDTKEVVPMYWDERDTPNICSCLLYLRPTTATFGVLKRWAHLMSKKSWEPNVQDQPYFNKALNTVTGLRVGVLPQRHFPPGPFFFANDTWRSIYGQESCIIHNNWVVGHDVKKQRFIDRGVWFVDEGTPQEPGRNDPDEGITAAEALGPRNEGGVGGNPGVKNAAVKGLVNEQGIRNKKKRHKKQRKAKKGPKVAAGKPGENLGGDNSEALDGKAKFEVVVKKAKRHKATSADEGIGLELEAKASDEQEMDVEELGKDDFVLDTLAHRGKVGMSRGGKERRREAIEDQKIGRIGDEGEESGVVEEEEVEGDEAEGARLLAGQREKGITRGFGKQDGALSFKLV